MSEKLKKAHWIAALILGLPIMVWLAYNAGFWVGETGSQTTP